MTVKYVDEYENELKISGKSSFLPLAGDSVEIDNEEWQVKARTFYPELDLVIISLTQSSPRTMQAESVDKARLNKMQDAIMNLTKRQDAQEKKTRTITEEVVQVTQHINQRIQKERKSNDEPR